jgi:hypothetical protein
MMPAYLSDERLTELLVQQATEGLSASETLELRGLLARHGRPDAEVIERTAAALLLAGTVEPEPMPSTLRKKLDLAADAFIVGELGQPANADELAATPSAARVEKPASSQSSIGWFVAAAAIVLAIVAWWPEARGPAPATQVAEVRADGKPSSSEARSLMLADASALTRSWETTDDPAAQGVSGDVVWDNEKQAGYMRFKGLPANDPSRAQYQLWIFDGSRGDQYPVDGGVFDVPPGSEEVIVPIDAKLPVSEPQLFAVTVEKPGGVVVSSRERIVVLAKTAPG